MPADSDREMARACGLEEVTSSIAEFYRLIEGPESNNKDMGESETCHVATIGADFYIYEDAGYKRYVVAGQGHAGGDSISPARERPITYWITPAEWPKLRAWRTAIKFVTGMVDADLVAEWGEVTQTA